MKVMRNAVLFALAYAAGNFIWQAASGHYDWHVAFERSYFQGFAVLMFAYQMRGKR